MTYYEELAVAQNASLEEIRQAYRGLARLLHPDGQSDARLKSAAERQMVRLNEILDTLADPEKRRKYDESLGKMVSVPVPTPSLRPPPTHSLRRHWPWGLASCILLIGGIWYLRSNESGDALVWTSPAAAPSLSGQPPRTTVSKDTPPVKERRRPRPLRARSRSLALSQTSPLLQDYSSGGQPAPEEVLADSSEPAAIAPGEQKETAAPPARAVQATPEEPARPPRMAGPAVGLSFAGRWLYAPRALDPQTPGMYPPEFIEFFLSDDRGALSGTYWARYRIPDKAVSPEVRFRVYGAFPKAAAVADATTVKWVSDDGARGQLKMVLRNENSLEVTWWASEFGSHTALTSGTALLVRQPTQ